jgi:YD repeat-containing protein
MIPPALSEVSAATTKTITGNVGVGTDGQDRLTTTFTYLDNGRVHTTSVGGRTTTFTYDPAGNVTRSVATGTDELDGSTTTVDTATVYNDVGLPTEVRVENGSTDLITRTAYDERGLPTGLTSARGSVSGADPADHTVTTTYDLLGRPVRVELPPVDVAYAADPSAGVDATWTTGTARPDTEVGYDAFGNETHRSDANDRVTVTSYDDLDRRTRIDHPSYTPPGSSTPITAFEEWDYTPNGNVASYRDRAGDVTTYAYDDANRVVRTTDEAIPVPGMDVLEQPAGVTEQFYDWAGRLTRTVDPEGGVVDNAYDTFGRLRTSTATIRAVADQPALTDVTTTGYSWLGYATSTDDGATTATTTYNAFGEVATHTVGTFDVPATATINDLRVTFDNTATGPSTMVLTYTTPDPTSNNQVRAHRITESCL